MAWQDLLTFENGLYKSTYMEDNEILRWDATMLSMQPTFCKKENPYNYYNQPDFLYNCKSTSRYGKSIKEALTYLHGTTYKRLAAYIYSFNNATGEQYQLSFKNDMPRDKVAVYDNICNPFKIYHWISCSEYSYGVRNNSYGITMSGAKWLPKENATYAPVYIQKEEIFVNFPVLETYEDWLEFVTADEPDWSKVINKPSDYESLIPVYSDFYANQVYSITENGVIGNDIIRFQKFRQRKPNSTYLFYDKYSTAFENLKLCVDANKPLSRVFHNDGTGYVADADIYYSTFANTGQKEIGQSIYTSIFKTNIAIFSNQADADAYVNAVESKIDADIEEALERADNYDYISNKNNYNPIGQEVTEVKLNDGYSRQAFTTILAMDFTALSEINNKVFDSQGTFIEAILNGLKLYGANPIDAVISLNYMPFNVSEVATTTIQNHVNFGSYLLQLDNSVHNVQNPRVVIDMGSILFNSQSGSWLDFEPVTEMYIWLPYIGLNKLDISKYYLKTVKLEYIVDLNTSSCTAVLSGNNVILDYFDGTIGVNMPITGYNNGEYANAVLNATTNTIKSGVATLTSVVPSHSITEKSETIQYNTGDIFSNFGSFEKNLFALTQTLNSNHMYIKGNASSGVAMCQPQYPIVYLVKNEVFEPENLHNLVGYPSSFGGKVKNCSGYLQCNDVKLTSTATDKEKQEIISLLKSGIYV